MNKFILADLGLIDKKLFCVYNDREYQNMVTATDQVNVLNFSRKVLEESVNQPSLRSSLDWVDPLVRSFPVSGQSAAALFVTLKKSERLRGCVGSVTPERPYLRTVAKFTMRAAFEDPRFPPVGPSELPQIRIEISILSPMWKIDGPDEIVRGLHGVYMKNKLNSGLFLPQVWEKISNKEQFLSELAASKVGLKPEGWKDPQTEIYIFTVEKFEEGTDGLPPAPSADEKEMD